MDIKMIMKDSDVKYYQIGKPIIGEVLEKLKEVSLNDIERIDIKERYIYGKDSLTNLREKINNYSDSTSSSVSIENVTDYTFDITVEGKILDSLSMFYHLGLANGFSKMETYLNTDLNLIDYILRGVRLRYELNTSLIMRFLSEHNGNVNYNYVLDIIRKDINKTDLKEFLPNLFRKLYGIKIDEAKIDTKGDKLDLTSIKMDELKKIDDELHTRLTNGGRS